MEMSDLRWILLSAAIVVVVGVYFFSRARKKNQPASLLDAADEVPSFSAQNETVDNDWMHGVGPVRVMSDSEPNVIPEVKFIEDDVGAQVNAQELIENSSTEFKSDTPLNNAVSSKVFQKNTQEKQLTNKTEKIPTVELSSEKQSIEKNITEKESQPAVDDVISIYVLAKAEEKINGEKVLSASYALHLDYGEMKIFHRHSQTSERNIEFSMANIQQPGWFEIDNMNDMQTTGVSFFMQVNLVENPSAVLDEMLICAHSLSTMLGAMLCNAQRKILDETNTKKLREKVKHLESVKSQSV